MSARYLLVVLSIAITTFVSNAIRCMADEPPDMTKHFVMIHGTSEPPGISRYFPAVAIESTDSSTILATASWGGELFPVPPNGRKVDRFHVLDSDQAVQLIACDEKRGVALFRIEVAMEPWPAKLVNQELFPDDKLTWLRLNNRHYDTANPKTTVVTRINTKLPYKTPTGKRVEVNDTIVFAGKPAGPPGTFLLKEGKLAAVWLNNEVSGAITSHALSAPAFMAGVRHLMKSNQSVTQ